MPDRPWLNAGSQRGFTAFIPGVRQLSDATVALMYGELDPETEAELNDLVYAKAAEIRAARKHRRVKVPERLQPPEPANPIPTICSADFAGSFHEATSEREI